MSHPLERFVVTYIGPARVVRACRGCKWFTARYRGGLGRGTGFILGNKQRGEAIQHVKQCDGVRALIEAHN